MLVAWQAARLITKGALTRWYTPWNWSSGFYEAIFYFYFIKSSRPYKSGGVLWSAGFYEIEIKIAL
jgi:hypothetical protein